MIGEVLHMPCNRVLRCLVPFKVNVFVTIKVQSRKPIKVLTQEWLRFLT